MEILDVIKTALALMAVLMPPLRYLYSRYKTNKGDLSWRAVNKAVLKLKKKMDDQGFTPSFIIGVGRGGGIVAAMLSHQFGRRIIPVSVLNFDYKHTDVGGMRQRVPIPKNCCQVKEGLQGGLLLGADIVSGATMLECMKILDERNVTYATACVYLNSETSNITPKFVVEERSKRPQYPWMPIPHLEIFDGQRPSLPDNKQ